MYRRGETSPSEVVRAVLDRIEAHETHLHAYLFIDRAAALAEAARWDARVRNAHAPPLAGIPIAVKDVICTREWPTTCGSRILEGFRSPYDATAVVRLREAAAILLCKTHCGGCA